MMNQIPCIKQKKTVENFVYAQNVELLIQKFIMIKNKQELLQQGIK